jgi:hypothetical protein
VYSQNTFDLKHKSVLYIDFNRRTKRGKEKSPSDEHCQCVKEIDKHLLACQQILGREPRSDTPCYIIFEN